MQCVNLAAGKGERMRPLTNDRPKPLVQVLGRPLLEHIIEALPATIDEIILVIGYRGEQIQKHFGTEYLGRSLRYVWQKEQRGTADALSLCKSLLRGRFFMLFADDLHGSEDLMTALQHELCLLAFEHKHPQRFGVISQSDDGFLKRIIEKPLRPETNLVSTGAMVLDERIFNYTSEPAENGERYLTDMIEGLAQDHLIRVVKQNVWIPVGYPEDIETAERFFTEALNFKARSGILK